MELQSYLGAVRRHWWVVLGTTALVVLASVAVVLVSAPKYQSTVSFFVNSTQDPKNLLQGDLYAQNRVDSYVLLASSDRLVDAIIAETGVPLTQNQLADQITASAQANTVVLNVAVTDSSADQSLTLAKSLSTQMPILVRELDPTVTMSIVSGPSLTPGAVSPRKMIDLGLGLLLGLGLGVAAAVLRERRGDKVRAAADLRSSTDVPVLAHLSRPLAETGLPAPANALDAETRSALTRVCSDVLHHGAPTLVVADSSGTGDAAVLIVWLAATFADAGRTVVLVEADLRDAPLEAVLGLPFGRGTSDVLAGDSTIDNAIQRTADERISVMGAGAPTKEPESLLARRSTAPLLSALRTRFDVVLVHAPALLPLSDASVVAQDADGVIMSVRRDVATHDGARKAVKLLQELDVSVLGTILTTPSKHADADARTRAEPVDEPSLSVALAKVRGR